MRIINEVRFDDDDIKEYQKTIYMNIIKGNKLDWIQVRNYYEKYSQIKLFSIKNFECHHTIIFKAYKY